MALQLTDDQKLASAARFAATSRENDADAYRALCAPGALTWHNFDDAEVTTEHTVRTVGWLHRTVPDVEISTLRTDVALREQTDMDSIDFLRFLVAVHDAIGVDVPEVDYKRMRTLDDMIGYLAVRKNPVG